MSGEIARSSDVLDSSTYAANVNCSNKWPFVVGESVVFVLFRIMYMDIPHER